MANILDAIMNLVTDQNRSMLRSELSGHNRMNSMGSALEEYVKDLFADTLGETDPATRMQKQAQVFSYLGNQNNPPDAMLRGGDAIEVKKIESEQAVLALNSSYPKARLFANSPMIKAACRSCEAWVEKDMLYVVGVTPLGARLQTLAMVYGEDYCAEAETYERIRATIKTGVAAIPGVEFAETKELGRVNRVDPLGITYLRVRGMWGIENPLNVFDYVYRRQPGKAFNFVALINQRKYATFENREAFETFCARTDELEIANVLLRNPNNPAQLRAAKRITFTI